MDASSQLRSHHDYTIGWICALRKEQTAATAMLDDIHDDLPNPPKDPNAYTLGSIGKHNIVISCLPEGKYGTTTAATAATWMASTFPSVRFGLMVGIGGGIPSNKVRLGDVVVSKPDSCFPGVIQWDLGKIEQGNMIEHTGSLNNPPTALLTSLAKLGTKREMQGSQIPYHLAAMGEKWPKLATKYTRLESLRDTLFADDYLHIPRPSTQKSPHDTHTSDTETEYEDWENEAADCRFCDMSKARKRKSKGTRIHYGLIASGNMVVKDAQFRNQLNERFCSKILCIEMEAAGLMNDFPCLVIRGVCDYADSHKNKAWQEYAAAVAAAFAKELLLVVPVHAVEQMDTITSTLSDIRTDVNLAVGYLEEARVHRHNQEDKNILEWISPFDYGAEHSDVLKRWQPGTGQWLLKSIEFNEFIGTNKRVIFCPGIPGAGKTVMTATVIDYLHKRFSNDCSIGIAYIYFNFKRQNDQTPEAVFSSLLKQIARQQPSLHQNVKSLHKTYTKTNARPSLRDIIKTFQDVSKTYSRVFVVIDALDECTVLNDCREIILSEIMACTERSNLSLFTTSRHIPEISNRFQTALRLEIGAIESDIRTYIDSRLFKLSPTSIIKQSKVLQEEIKTGINAAMDRINQQSLGRSQLAINTLSWITHAKRPLSVTELQHALGVEIGDDQLDQDNIPQIEDIVSTTVGLVTIDERSKVIRLVHYTAQEFFERTREKWFPDAETYIAEICSCYLSYTAFENGYCQEFNEYLERVNSFKLYKYAVENWKHHVTGSKFSHMHLRFLQKTSNLNTFLQASQIEAEASQDGKYSSGDLSIFPHMYLTIDDITSLHIAAESGWNTIVEILLRDISDADVCDSRNRTPFYLAASGGYDTIMATLVNSGQVNVNVITIPLGYTPLICAAQGGHVAAVRWLLVTGKANAGIKCEGGKVALWYAAVGGHIDVVRLLLDARNYNPDMVREIYSSALLGAVLGGEEIIVNLLLDTGYADVNVQTTNRYLPFSLDHPFTKKMADNNGTMGYSMNQHKSPLCLAIEFGHESLVKLFLGMEEVDVDLESEYREVALSLAAKRGRVNIFQLLLDSGRFDMNYKNHLGQTLLMTAASNGHESLVKLILNNDIHGINSSDKKGRTALFSAIDQSPFNKENLRTLKILIETGRANINIKEANGVAPLWNVILKRNEDAVKQLLEAQGIDTNMVDEHGGTILSLAVGNRSEGIVTLCLKTGKFDINVRDRCGVTPLLFGAIDPYQDLNVIKLLLATDNVDINAKDFLLELHGVDYRKKTNKHRRTALMWAAYCGNNITVAVLLRSDKFDVQEVDLDSLDSIAIALK